MIKTQRQSVSTCTTLPSIFSLVDSIKSTQYWHFSRVATVISARHLGVLLTGRAMRTAGGDPCPSEADLQRHGSELNSAT